MASATNVWIGPPDQTEHPQPSLIELSKAVAAQYRHLRLLRRLGRGDRFIDR